MVCKVWVTSIGRSTGDRVLVQLSLTKESLEFESWCSSTMPRRFRRNPWAVRLRTFPSLLALTKVSFDQPAQREKFESWWSSKHYAKEIHRGGPETQSRG